MGKHAKNAQVCTALISARYPTLWWSDGLGAIVIAIYIIFMWIVVAKEQMEAIVGKVIFLSTKPTTSSERTNTATTPTKATCIPERTNLINSRVRPWNYWRSTLPLQ